MDVYTQNRLLPEPPEEFIKRLTEWYDDGKQKGVMVKEEAGDGVLKTLFTEEDEGYLGLCRLKEYEDTGLEPYQVEELREKYTAKTPALEGDGCADGEMVYDIWVCPGCGTEYELDYDEYHFCPKCGQAIDWEESEEE